MSGRYSYREYVPPATGPCGKVGYLTRAEAKAAARRRQAEMGRLLQAYRCPLCDGLPWHLTKRAWRDAP